MALRDWILIGNLDNRRITGFAEAAARQGHRVLAQISWAQIADDPDVLLQLPDRPAWLRIESAGEDAELERRMRVLGGGTDREIAFGQLFEPRCRHLGFGELLQRIAAALEARPAWIPLATPEAIAHVFDKAAFHTSCVAQGVAVAPGVEASSYGELCAVMEASRIGAVFVKLRFSSSAVGLGLYRHRPRPMLLTTVRVQPEGWFNSRRLSRYTHGDDLAVVFEGLFAEGAHVEHAIPKAMLGGANFDCRVVMVDSEPAFVVVRQSRHPITNLHLGGWRGDVDAMLARCPEAVWSAAMDDCRAVARSYGGLHLGIDLLIERGFQGHRILEANAFGDLLPGLQREGMSVYDWEIHRVGGWHSEATPG